jgi:hypothetical protein
MGILQKLSSMAQIGTVKIDSSWYKDDNQMGYNWYYVSLTCPDVTFTSEMPTLKDAIDSIHRQIEIYNTKINIGNTNLFR